MVSFRRGLELRTIWLKEQTEPPCFTTQAEDVEIKKITHIESKETQEQKSKLDHFIEKTYCSLIWRSLKTT